MSNVPLPSELDALASTLALRADEHAGDYPVVSFIVDPSEPVLRWSYSRLVVEVAIRPGAVLSVQAMNDGVVVVEAQSAKQGLALLQRTEGIRQGRDLPYIQLG